jgi:hypothetical protein
MDAFIALAQPVAPALTVGAVHTAKPGVTALSGASPVTCARILDRSSQQRIHRRGHPPRAMPAAATIRHGRSNPISGDPKASMCESGATG